MVIYVLLITWNLFNTEFKVMGQLHRNNILIYIQQDATLHSLFYLETALRHPQHTQTSSNSSSIAADSNNGVTNTRCL